MKNSSSYSRKLLYSVNLRLHSPSLSFRIFLVFPFYFSRENWYRTNIMFAVVNGNSNKRPKRNKYNNKKLPTIKIIHHYSHYHHQEHNRLPFFSLSTFISKIYFHYFEKCIKITATIIPMVLGEYPMDTFIKNNPLV